MSISLILRQTTVTNAKLCYSSYIDGTIFEREISLLPNYVKERQFYSFCDKQQ